MIKILLVDDDNTSRLALKYVFSRFEDIEITEAVNGHEAVELCRRNMFDIICMDMEMPVMDGYHAIEHIRVFNKESIIVCISGDNTLETIHRMAKIGADDYILKPISADIVRLRFSSYKRLLDNQTVLGFEARPINLFNEPVFDYITTFRVSYEGSLARFWEYYDKHIGDDTAMAVIAIFNLGTMFLSSSKRFLIFVEKSEEHVYFTVVLPSLQGKLDIAKQLVQSGLDYELAENKFSLKCKRVHMQEVAHIAIPEVKSKVETVPEIKKSEPQPIIVHQDETLHVYDFIDKDDLVELGDNIADLESTLAVLQYSSLSEQEVLMVADSLVKIGQLLTGYNETFNIASAFYGLGQVIKENVSSFVAKSTALSGLFISFCNDLSSWRQALFFDGAPRYDFMDATILSNIQMVENIIVPKQQAQEDDEDVFNF